MNKLTIFSSKTCAPCRTLKYLLDKDNIPYQIVDVDETPSAWDTVVALTGFQSVPVTTNGLDVVQGMNMPRIKQLIQGE